MVSGSHTGHEIHMYQELQKVEFLFPSAARTLLPLFTMHATIQVTSLSLVCTISIDCDLCIPEYFV